MKNIISLVCLLIIFQGACSQNPKKINLTGMEINQDFNVLTEAEKEVIIHKGTERPFTGKLLHNKESGTYICKRCDAPLYSSKDKFESHCGWPSFDDEIDGAVKRLPDADGRRVEIVCANCGGHLGHVFEGEGFTDKNVRHCVNSISMKFISKNDEVTTAKQDTAIFASGCFWGTEYYLAKAKGVLSTTAGYIGGHKRKPTYEEICTKKTGHKEAVLVTFDPQKTNFETLTKLFFETHDPTQTNGQGPDIGEQYLSYIFYKDEHQKQISKKLIKQLEEKGLKIATKLEKISRFWEAESYHQDYYENKGGVPYCHKYTKRF